MLAGVESRDYLLRVQAGGSEQFNGIHSGVVQHILKTLVKPGRDAPLGGSTFGALSYRVVKSDNIAVIMLPVPRRVQLTDRSTSNDREIYLVQLCLRRIDCPALRCKPRTLPRWAFDRESQTVPLRANHRVDVTAMSNVVASLFHSKFHFQPEWTSSASNRCRNLLSHHSL